MTLQPDDAALGHAQSGFPHALVRNLWSETTGSRAVAIVEVDLLTSTYLHQIAFLQTSGGWAAVAEGPAPGWLSVDEPFGLVTRVDNLEPTTTAVKLMRAGRSHVVRVRGMPRLFRALWDVQRDDATWEWPEIVALKQDMKWVKPVLPGVPLTAEYLLHAYLVFEADRDPTHFWAWDIVNAAVASHPVEAWQFLRRAIHDAAGDEIVVTIGAGPLEDLVRAAPAGLVSEIRAAAGADKKVALALDAAWGHGPGRSR